MKKLLSVLLTLSLIVCLVPAAFAASAPAVHAKASSLDIHTGDTVTLSFSTSYKGDFDCTVAQNNDGTEKIKVANQDVAEVGSVSYTNGVPMIEFNGIKKGSTKATITLTISYDPEKDADGNITGWNKHKDATYTVKLSVADDFAPKLRDIWFQYNENTGYPQIKTRQTDDFGLKNICYVRHFTGENGEAKQEIYDITELYNKTEAIVFRTLDKPGQYSLQINDNADKTHRLNTKVLITLLDTDGNGVADAFYTDDETQITKLDVEGGVTIEQPEEAAGEPLVFG